MKTIVILSAIIFSTTCYCQIENEPQDSLKEYFGEEVVIYNQEYLSSYNRIKKLIVKVYPYALYAADVIDEIDANADNLNKRRKKNAFYKDSYKSLKEDFKYFLLDLYTSEGAMLMKLIHRETQMTVYEISSKYQSKQKAEIFELMAKIWDQDIRIEFDTTQRNDKIAEHVIHDIQSGLIPFNDEVVTIDKLEYRTKKQAENRKKKIQQQKNKDYEKERKRKLKDRERAEKKQERNQK